jgi:hypothetical protein
MDLAHTLQRKIAITGPAPSGLALGCDIGRHLPSEFGIGRRETPLSQPLKGNAMGGVNMFMGSFVNQDARRWAAAG